MLTQPADLCTIMILYMHDLTLIPPTESRTTQCIINVEGGIQAILRLVSPSRVGAKGVGDKGSITQRSSSRGCRLAPALHTYGLDPTFSLPAEYRDRAAPL